VSALGVGTHRITCDVGGIARPTLATLDALCRMQASAAGIGARLRLRHASAELRELLELSGLADLVPCEPDLPVEARRQAEEREEALGVQEERDGPDPIP
jgi:STAS domain